MGIAKYTWVINSYRCLPYLKLAIKSIRENAYYQNQPIIVYTENDDETAEWITSQSDITAVVEYNDVPVGIGGGVNKCVERVQTEFFSLIHSDMVVSRAYDKPLYDIVSATDKPIVAGSWRLEPNIWNQPTRLGTIMCPINADDGLGVYHHDFDWNGFLSYADSITTSSELTNFRKVEGVSYMMRTKYFIPNDARFAPSSFEDHMQSVLMQLKGYDFVISGKALAWHFGARSSHFLGQTEKLIGTSDRQKECEARNIRIWVDLWGSPPEYDEVGFIKVTPSMQERYKQNKQLYLKGKL